MISGLVFAPAPSFNALIAPPIVSAPARSAAPPQIRNCPRDGLAPTLAVGAIAFILTCIAPLGLIARFGDRPRLMGADPSRR